VHGNNSNSSSLRPSTQQLAYDTGNVQLAIKHGVPRSTARDWKQSSTSNVISLDVLSMSEDALRQEVLALRQQNARLTAILRLVVVLVRVTGVSLTRRRVPDAAKKKFLLRAVSRSRNTLSLRSALRLLGLSSSRYHTWKREESCELGDVSSCPRRFPHQLTVDEVAAVKDMVTADEYRHVPTGSLALLAQRLGAHFRPNGDAPENVAPDGEIGSLDPSPTVNRTYRPGT
jgi:hypothetical protein